MTAAVPLAAEVEALYRAFAAYPKRVLSEYPGEVPSARGGFREGIAAQRKLKHTPLRRMDPRNVDDYFVMYREYPMDRARKVRSLKHVLPRLFELLAAEVLTPTAADARLSLYLQDVADELAELDAWPAPEQAAIRAFLTALLAATPSPPDRRLAPFARVVSPVTPIMPA